jgi:hypothetical protein
VTSFVCSVCNSRHPGMPMGYLLPFSVASYPDDVVTFERDGELVCVAEDRFVLANIELPVSGRPDEKFIWTCWISLSQESYDRMQWLWDNPDRAKQDSAFGYVSSILPTYEPSTFALKSRVHNRAVGLRPRVELESVEHPLAVEQLAGITEERIAAVYHYYEDHATRESGGALP